MRMFDYVGGWCPQSSVFFVTIAYVCLLDLVERGNCCTLVLGKNLSDDEEGYRKA